MLRQHSTSLHSTTVNSVSPLLIMTSLAPVSNNPAPALQGGDYFPFFFPPPRSLFLYQLVDCSLLFTLAHFWFNCAPSLITLTLISSVGLTPQFFTVKSLPLCLLCPLRLRTEWDLTNPSRVGVCSDREGSSHWGSWGERWHGVD